MNLRRNALMAASRGGGIPGIDTWLRFPLDLGDFDYFEETPLYIYGSKNIDDTTIELSRVLSLLLELYGDKCEVCYNYWFDVDESVLNKLDISITFKGFKVIHITGSPTFDGGESIRLDLDGNYFNDDVYGGVDFIYIRENGEIFIEY